MSRSRALRFGVSLLSLGALAMMLLPAPPVAAKAGDWLGKLSKNDVEDVFRVIETIRERKDSGAAFDLLQAGMKMTEPHLTVSCGEALRAMGEEELTNTLFKGNKDFAKWWKKALKSKDASDQMNMARMLGIWGHPKVDEGMAHLCSGRRPPEVQIEALLMAGSLRPGQNRPFKHTRKAILEGLGGRTDEVKCAAASAAARWRDPIFKEALDTTVRKDRGDYAGLYAVWALRQIGWDEGISSFAYVLSKNPKRTTQQANLKAITELSNLRDVDDLLSMTKSSRQDVRDAAVLALGRMPWRALRGRLPNMRDSGRAEVTGEVKKEPGVGELPTPPLDIPDKVIDRLIELVRSEKTWEVRDAARQGLIRFGKRAQPKVIAAMPDLVNFSQQDVAYTAIELCGLFGAKAAFNDILKIALYEKRDRALRMLAFRALEGMDPEMAVTKLTDAYKPRPKASDNEVLAVRGLGYIRTRRAFDAALDIATSLQSFSEEMRREAEFALERLTAHRFGRDREVWTKWIEGTEHPFYPRIAKFDRAENRRLALENGSFGLTEKTERAVEGGLLWLQAQQKQLGYWDGNEKGFGGVVNCEPAYTGLSVLAFLGAGYQGRHGKYRESIRRSAEFLAASQFYDGGFPVTGGGDDSWIYAYLIGMAVWGLNEAYGLTQDPQLAEPAQWGIDYLVRVQTPGAGWRYGPCYVQSDTSCTSWVLMGTKMADLVGLEVSQKSWDGIDDWLERCSLDITGETEKPADMSSDYEYEVGIKRTFQAFTSYFELSESDSRGAQKISMTAVGMVCRFFMGWKRSHPFQIGSANFLLGFLPQWMGGMNKDQNVAWYHYYWYYGTLAMHQMGGKYWRAWNQKVKRMYPDKQRRSPVDLVGSWDPDPTVLNGGRLFSTAMSILSLETYYRFSPLLGKAGDDEAAGE